MSEENEDPTRSFLTRDAYDKEDQWQENKDKLEHPGYSYVRHTSDEYISGMRNASDGYAWGAMQLNISDLKDAMGEGSDYDDTALKRELEKQGKEIETNAKAIEGKADEDHTHDNIPDPYDDSWIQPEIDKKSDLTHTHDITHDHDTEYQQKGDYADKNHIHDLSHNHDGEYLTSDDLPDPYDDTQIRDDFAAADQQLQDQITIINDAGYDDTAINQRVSDEEQARADGDASLSVKIDGKADDDHTHDPIDLEHDHNSQYQPIGDYATKTDLDSKSDTTHSHTPQDLTHDHNSEYQPIGNYADTDHSHPPQDLTHDHDTEYAPVHEHPYADTNHTHPPQDLTHDHDAEYQPVGDYATNQTVADGDADLQGQIDAISNSGGYNDSWIEPAIAAGDASTLSGANAYTDAEVAKIVVPDVSDFATTDYVDAGDQAVEAKIPDVSGFATNQELTDGLAGKSDTSHEHDEFTHTHDFSHDHDGEYALEHDHPYAPQTHNHPHDHEGEYQPTGDYSLEGHEHLHDHDGTYQPAGNYSEIGHEHLHDHDGQYQPPGNYTKKEYVDASDQNLQDQINAIQSSGYDDTQIRLDFAAADTVTLASANTYTDEEVAKIVVPDVGDFATKTEVADGDAATLADANAYTDSKVYDATDLESRVTANEGDITDIKAEQITQNAAIAQNETDIAAIVVPDVSDFTTKTYVDAADATKFDKGATTYADAGAMEAAIKDNAESINTINNSGYDDSELRGLIADEESARSVGDAGLQDQINAIQSSGYDDTQLRADFAAADATTLASANTYTDEEVAKVFVPDVSDFATKTEVADGDSSTLTSANTYTDEEISKIPAPTPPYDDTAIKNLISDEETARVAGDQNLQDQIDTIQSSGYDDTQLRADFAAADAATLDSANTYTDEEISKIPPPTPPYDDTQVKSDIQANKDSIEALGEKGYDDTAVKADIQANAAAIEENKTAIQAIDVPDVSDFATRNEVADGDTETLTTANSYTDAEIAKIPDTDVSNLATKEELSTGLAGKADEPHTHDTSHNHNSEYQPLGDYATGSHTHDTSHTHDEFSDKDHTHPPQDLTHDHDAQYAPVHNHPYASDDHSHPPQDLTHDHQGEYQPVGDYPTKTEMTAADAAVEAKIPDVSNFATKTEVGNKLDKGSTTYLDAKAIEDDISGISSSISDLSQNYDQLILDLGDAGSELQVELTGYLKKGTASYADAAGIETDIDQEKVDRANADSSLQDMINSHSHDTTHNHNGLYSPTTHLHDDNYAGKTHTHPPQDLTHNHDGTYQPSGDYASGNHTHDTTHNHSEYIAKESDNSSYKEWLLKANGNKRNPADFASAGHTHPPQDLTHSHSEYFPSGVETDEDGNQLPLPYPDANALGEAVDGKADAHTHPYVNTNKDSSFTHTDDYKWTKLISRQPKKADGANDHTTEWGIKIDLDEGNTYKNQFEVGTSRYGYALKVLGGNGKEVWIGGHIRQKGGNLDNPRAEDYVTRRNLNEHTHEEYMLSGDWDEEDFPDGGITGAELWDYTDSMFSINDFNQKLQDAEIKKKADITVTDDLLSRIEALEKRVEDLETMSSFDSIEVKLEMGKGTSGRPTGSACAEGVAEIWYLYPDGPTDPKNEMKIQMSKTINEAEWTNKLREAHIVQGNKKQVWRMDKALWVTGGEQVIHFSSNDVTGDTLTADAQTKILFFE